MPYDLYGQYYANMRDAENAEMAQCAEIDARMANKKVQELEKKLQQSNPQEDIYNLWQYVQMLEDRIKQLETTLKQTV